MPQLDAEVTNIPPSAKLVLKVLEYDDELTQKELVERTRLSQRTVRDAINRLLDRGIIEKGIYVPDGRKDLYTLSRRTEDGSGGLALSTE